MRVTVKNYFRGTAHQFPISNSGSVQGFQVVDTEASLLGAVWYTTIYTKECNCLPQLEKLLNLSGEIKCTQILNITKKTLATTNVQRAQTSAERQHNR